MKKSFSFLLISGLISLGFATCALANNAVNSSLPKTTTSPDNDDCRPLNWFRDSDGDGFGDPNNGTFSCSPLVGYVGNSLDCNDNDVHAYPHAVPYNLNIGSITTSTALAMWNPGCGVKWQTRRSKLGLNQWSCALVTVNNRTLTGMDAGTEYEAQVRCIYGPADTSAWSSSVTFTTTSTCLNATELNTDEISFFSARLNWTNQSTGGKRIRYHVVNSPTWITIVKKTSETSHLLTGLLLNTQYEWQIRTGCTNGELTKWSSSATFATGNLSEARTEETRVVTNNIQLDVYPNPTTGISTVDAELAYNGKVIISVVNLLGQEVFNKETDAMQGDFNTTVDFSQYPNGIYTLSLKTEQGIETKRIVKE